MNWCFIFQWMYILLEIKKGQNWSSFCSLCDTQCCTDCWGRYRCHFLLNCASPADRTPPLWFISSIFWYNTCWGSPLVVCLTLLDSKHFLVSGAAPTSAHAALFFSGKKASAHHAALYQLVVSPHTPNTKSPTAVMFNVTHLSFGSGSPGRMIWNIKRKYYSLVIQLLYFAPQGTNRNHGLGFSLAVAHLFSY